MKFEIRNQKFERNEAKAFEEIPKNACVSRDGSFEFRISNFEFSSLP
jgi:hypothetical protein